MITNETLILSNREVTEDGKTKRIIIIEKYNPSRNGDATKLADIFSEMPSGLIYKEETGIGATTLELTSQRNSIIVEPTRVTASSKATKHKALYVGGSTKTVKGTSDWKIKSYLQSKAFPKKIVVVADSLYRVMNMLADLKHQDFFLMIDEIDSFQIDSSFRKSMEACLDVYKLYPKEQRAMVTATALDFSDPLIVDPVTVLKYNVPTPRTINLISAKKILDKKNKGPKKKYVSILLNIAVNKVKELLQAFPDEKIMVACNSITGCNNMAQYLVKNGLLTPVDIKILCSVNSKNKVEEFFTELEGPILPAKLNFCTSAYFTGFDITERYHLISISSIKNKIQTLSDKRLKQIAGRCRDKEGLLSETVIFDSWTPEDEETLTIRDCINIAQMEIDALHCISHNYKSHPLLKANIDKIRELIVENTNIYGFRFVRWLSSDEPKVSYLNIDAFIEQLRTRQELYSNQWQLYDSLQKEGHSVTIFERKDFLKIEKNEIGKEERFEQVTTIVGQLRASLTEQDVITRLKENKTLTYLQKAILSFFLEYHELIEVNKLISLLESAAKKRDRRQLNNLQASAHFCTLPTSHVFKRAVNHHLPINSRFTATELLQGWNLILLESGIHKQLETEVQAVRHTKLYFRLVKKKNPVLFVIKHDNPFKLPLLK